ncbi:MAG TPA: hypothetical protein VK591_20775 [Xanthobacteraceae bacterium]|nr:hypothetical protein [Xanthobacteraceae bacterium]
MRRKQAFKRGRVLSIVVAGFAGYAIGGWNGSVPRSPELSAAQSVALRFPQDLAEASPVTVAFATSANAAAMGNTRLAMFSPQPMVASARQAPVQQASAAQLSTPQAPLQMASAEQAVPQPAPAAKRPNGIKPTAAAVHNREDRAAGLMLNDAQIASIKTRLHLTADQEQMWPAVEAALRNIAYTRSREAHQRSAPANTQVASADGVDVRDLKSAAIPLIMSFNSEQKDEVRNLAHVMGLDQLATQF